MKTFPLWASAHHIDDNFINGKTRGHDGIGQPWTFNRRTRVLTMKVSAADTYPAYSIFRLAQTLGYTHIKFHENAPKVPGATLRNGLCHVAYDRGLDTTQLNRVIRTFDLSCTADHRHCEHTDEDACRHASPTGYVCTRAKGHAGPHIACGTHEHNFKTWPQDS